MKKIKNKIIIIFAIMMLITIIIGVMKNVSFAKASPIDGVIEKKKSIFEEWSLSTVGQITDALSENKTNNKKEKFREVFLTSPISKLIGEEIPTNTDAPIKSKWAYCIDPHAKTEPISNKYKFRITNIIEVKDIYDFKMYDYNAISKNAKGYDITDKDRKYLYSMMTFAGMSQNNWKDRELTESGTDVLKAHMARYIWVNGDTMVNRVMLNEGLTPKKDGYSLTLYKGKKSVQQADKHIKKFMNTKFRKLKTIEDAKVTEYEQKQEIWVDQTITNADGTTTTTKVPTYQSYNPVRKWKLIGPYKISVGGNASVKDVKIVGIKNSEILGWTSKHPGAWSTSAISYNGEWKEIPSGQEFWFVLKGDANPGETPKITLTSKDVTMYTGRMLLIYGKPSQNFAIYVINEESKPLTIDLTADGITVDYGDILIHKKREDGPYNATLDTVGFKIKQNATQQYVNQDAQGNITYGGEGTVFYTDDFGERKIEDLLAGEYTIYEVTNAHYGYDVDTKGPIATTVVKADEETETPINNTQKRTQISGYVWDDGIEGKNSSRDSVRGDGDKPISGISLALGGIIPWKEYNGLSDEIKNQKVNGANVFIEDWKEGKRYSRTITTDADGKYVFDDVYVNLLEYLSIDFYYDGLEYAPVECKINLDNGSKAVDSPERRQNLNKVFGVISNDENNTNHVKTNQDIIGDFSELEINTHLDDYKYSLGYNKGDHSSLIDTNSKEYSEAVGNAYLRTFARAGENDENSKCYKKDYTFKKIYDAIAATDVDSVMIENVNLGLYHREQPNISIKKDIDSAQLEINGYGHVYDYNRKDKDSDYQNQYKENLGVKFGKEWTPGEYQLPIYKSDYMYTTGEKDKSKELKAYITYKIELSNNSVGIDSKINTLFDYYDKTYDSTTISIGDNKDDLETNGRIKNKFNYKDKDYNDQYKKLEIDTSGITIEAGKTKTIYVQFEFSREQIYDIITSTDKDKNVLYNVAEVGSYASYYPADPKLDNDKQYKGQLYAGIDRSSSPGNATPGETKTYENDTDNSPALKLEQKAEERSIEGKVFLDDIVKPEGYNGDTDDLMTGYERLGNGEYDDETEKGIDGVKVMLKSKTDDTRVYYIGESKQSEKENDKNLYTSNGGDFEISGFIPDEYELVYTWGGQQVSGETISVENYKGTIYNDKERYDYNQNDNLWYNNDVKTRCSDAVDNMQTREDIDKNYRTVTWELRSDIKNIGKNEDKMNSTTPEMNIRIENTSDTKDGKVNSYKTTSSGIEVLDAKYEIQNIDFGIVERAKQKVELTKNVRKLKLTLANGQIISDAEFYYDKNGKLKVTDESEVKHMTYMGTNNKPDKGKDINNCFIKIELDNELIQGSTLEVEYELLFENNSEKDYWSEDKEYYKFGVKDNSEIIKIKPSRIVDYLDKDWGFESNKNTSWKVFTSKYDDIVRDSELLSLDTKDPFKDQNSYGNLTSGRVVIKNEAYKDDEVEPTQVKRMAMEVSKKLTITDEIELENDTEIVKMEIPHGGRPLTVTRTPGQYYPGNSLTELSDKAEKIIVTPSTGKDLNFVVPITIGVIALITLGAGIILIKKKVVDNK